MIEYPRREDVKLDSDAYFKTMGCEDGFAGGRAGKEVFTTVILNHFRPATIQKKTRRPALRGEFVRLRVDSSLGDAPMESCVCGCYLFGR